jgi:hypothetical protein
MYLDEVSEADWTDLQINVQINYSYMELYAAVIETYEDYYIAKHEENLKAGEQEYSLPDDFYKIRRVETKYASGDQYYKASPYNFDQFARSVESTDYGSTSRPRYDLSGSYLRLMPIPAEDVTDGIKLWYIKTISELVENTDEIDIPFADRYANLIPLGAASHLLRKGQQEEDVANKYYAQYQLGIEKMKQELENRYLDGTKMILDTTGSWVDFERTPGIMTIYP